MKRSTFNCSATPGAGRPLIMQVLRQIRERGDSAIVYDPACEYIQRFYDKDRGDIVLNPLDARRPIGGRRGDDRTPKPMLSQRLCISRPPIQGRILPRNAGTDLRPSVQAGTESASAGAVDGERQRDRTAGRRNGDGALHRAKAGPQRQGVSVARLVAKSFRLLPRRSRPTGYGAPSWAKHRKGWIFITSRPPSAKRSGLCIRCGSTFS